MAIVDSIALGKSTGSLGNVTFYQLKGQTVARYRNTSPADPKTTAQLTQRSAMKNTSLAFRLLKDWAKGLDTIKVGKQTYYNRYVSLLISSIGAGAHTDSLDVIKSVLYGGKQFGSDLVLDSPEIVDNHIRLEVRPDGLPFNSGWFVNAALVNVDNETLDFESKAITLTDWNNGYIDLDLLGSTNYSLWWYGYNRNVKQGANIIIQPPSDPSTIGKIASITFEAGGSTYDTIPLFSTDNFGTYEVDVDNTTVTFSIEWVVKSDDVSIIWNDEFYSGIDENVFTFPLDLAVNTLEITSNTLFGDVTYLFNINRV